MNLWMKVGIDRTEVPESEVILIPKVGAERNLVLQRLFYICRTNFFTFNHEALVSFAWLWVMIRNGTSFRSRNLTNRSMFRLFWTLFFKFTNILVPNFRDLVGQLGSFNTWDGRLTMRKGGKQSYTSLSSIATNHE